MSIRLKELRKGKKLSQEEFAQKFNEFVRQRNPIELHDGKGNVKQITYSAVSRWENGSVVIPSVYYKSLADFFGVTVPYLQGISYDANDILMFVNSDYFDRALGSNAPYADKLTFELRKYLEASNIPMPEDKFSIEELASFTDDVKKYWRENIGFIFEEEPYKNYLLNSDLSKIEILNIVAEVIKEKRLELTETEISQKFVSICGDDFYFWENNKENLMRFASKKDIQKAINHLQQSLNVFSDKLADLPENKNIAFEVPDSLKNSDKR